MKKEKKRKKRKEKKKRKESFQVSFVNKPKKPKQTESDALIRFIAHFSDVRLGHANVPIQNALERAR